MLIDPPLVTLSASSGMAKWLSPRGYGLANLEDRVPITPDTVFHLASLSKQFTASAIALLILDHKLSLDDPVARYIPETAKYGPDLRIKHLVYMTSGLHEYFDVPRPGGLPWYSAYRFTRDDALAAALSPPSLEFAPGTKWAYSNTNYMLLTKIVEKISGQPLPASCMIASSRRSAWTPP
jgi:CubicO group peptidase (beta-lactamase class C family)